MNVSMRLAQFVEKTNYEDIPPDVIAVQKQSVIDGLAVILGAATLGDGCDQMVKAAKMLAEEGNRESTVIGFDIKLTAAWAAFANASMAHSLDYEDTHSTNIHTNSSTLPAALAAAERIGGVDGKLFLSAVVIGSEIACRLSAARVEEAHTTGFFMPTILTAFAATTAVAKLMKLTAEEIVNAWSFTLCQTTCSNELLNSPKTCVRSIREAFAAQIALISCEMAKNGLIGFPEPFEGKQGFFFAYVGAFDKEKLFWKLGEYYMAQELSFKFWPSCFGTHASINCALNLVKEHNITPDEITRVHVNVGKGNEMLFVPENIRKAPASSIIAKFSIPYTCAHAIIYGSLKLDSFTEEKLHNETILDLAQKFSYFADPDKTSGRSAEMTIYTRDRGEFTNRVEAPIGTPEHPMSRNDFIDKIRSCIMQAPRKRSDEEITRLVNTVFSLEEIPDITQLTAQLL